jgi:acyl carrier protein
MHRERDLSNSDIAARLETCFAAVFPDLQPEQLRAAQAERVAAWDSMATVTLMAVINEEFGTDLDLDQMEPLGSFDALRSELEIRFANG